MKYIHFSTLLFILLSGCNEKQNTEQQASMAVAKVKHSLKLISSSDGVAQAPEGTSKIAIQADRWYQLNNSQDDLAALFDGVTDKSIERTWSKVLEEFDAYYPLLDDESMTLKAIKFYDWEGTFDTPMELLVIDSNWERIPIGSFTGERYATWVGPNPDKPDQFILETPIEDVRYLVIRGTSNYPSEIEFYGDHNPGTPLPTENAPRQVKLKHTFGVNAFEWDVVDGGRGTVINEKKVEALRNFTAIRHYMDWERLETTEGVYGFNPTISGGWDYDLIYQRLQEEGIDVLACLKTIPSWLSETYPKDMRDAENSPLAYNADPLDPASYTAQAKVAFQYAARYGSNKNVDDALLENVSTGILYPGAKNSPERTVEKGMDLVKYIECDNERDKWWKGRKGYQTAREYAANMSAFYDGHKGTLGKDVGVKNADENMQVVIGGLTGPNIDYLKGMVDWCKEFRGYHEDGTVNLCWDIVNYHNYSSNAKNSQGNEASRGVAPERSNIGEGAKKMMLTSLQYSQDMEVWISELGFDVNQGSPIKAIPIGDKTPYETQADWILRSSLLYARSGVEKVYFYQLYDIDINSGGKFASMGLANKGKDQPKPAATYLRQTNQLMGEYIYQETIHEDPIVDRYELDGKSAYILLVPDEKGREETFTLKLGKDIAKVNVHRPAIDKAEMDREEVATTDGAVKLTVTETPLFVLPVDDETASNES